MLSTNKATKEIIDEYLDASKIHGATFHNPHEAYGIVSEEYIEFQDEVFKRDHDFDLMYNEAKQLAGVAMKTMVSIDKWRNKAAK
jgi:hypothetical protein